MNIVKHSIRIPQILIHAVFKVNSDDVIICNSIF